MEHAQPRHLSRRRVEQLLSYTKTSRSAAGRIEILSRHFVGLPYQNNPLIGSADTPEVFTVSLDRFDCVTYIETVLALALASNTREFADWLRKIRYECGRITWKRRNHYMTGWIRSNLRGGALRRVSFPRGTTVVKERMLDVVPGLSPVRTRFTCVPKRAFGGLAARLETGDLVFFASTRPHLDVFHCGVVARDGKKILMRHASRGRGAVVEQEMSEFLNANRMAGVIVARPKRLS
jgi:hypothetical protein